METLWDYAPLVFITIGSMMAVLVAATGETERWRRVTIICGATVSLLAAFASTHRQNDYEREQTSRAIATLNNVTGGDSEPSLLVSIDGDKLIIILTSFGLYPIYDLRTTVRILEDDLEGKDRVDVALKDSFVGQIDLGTLPPDRWRDLGSWRLSGKIWRMQLHTMARNGFWSDRITARRVGGKWVTAHHRARLNLREHAPVALPPIPAEMISGDFPINADGSPKW